MAEQQVQLTDLDPEQLQQVKKQLDEVSEVGERARCAGGAAFHHLPPPPSPVVEARARASQPVSGPAVTTQNKQ